MWKELSDAEKKPYQVGHVCVDRVSHMCVQVASAYWHVYVHIATPNTNTPF